MTAVNSRGYSVPMKTMIFILVSALFFSVNGQAQTELSLEDQKIWEMGEIPSERYMVGGITGSLVGFGIGHAIQGRYQDKGWFFTAGELGAILVASAGLRTCVNDITFYRECNSTTFLVGSFAFLGFRIWEVVDLWAGPPHHNKRYQKIKNQKSSKGAHFYWDPNPQNMSLGLNWIF